MSIKSILLTLIVLSSGCATYIPLERLGNETKTTFTYDYEIESTNQNKLWKSARDYFAGAYGDSKSVIRVIDESEGTIIGKGTFSWLMGSSQYTITCLTDYHIRFIAKDNKARLQLEIINSVPPLSKCTGWPLPSKNGYDLMLKSFQANSNALEIALNGGGSTNDFKDF